MRYLRTWTRCRKILLPLLVLALTVLLAAGCGAGTGASGSGAGSGTEAAGHETAEAGGGTEAGGHETAEAGGETDSDEEDDKEEGDLYSGDKGLNEDGTDPDDPKDLPDRDGTYTTAEDVALYLHTYGTLPKNFMTKKEARKLGWEGGSLERFAPGMCIGGDRFGNYEGVLPEGSYHECDINTLGKSKRGAERLVFDDQGRIYYTDDHYETFTLLYGGE